MKRKSPHVKPIRIVSMQVCKLGSWEGNAPYALMLDVFEGGSLQVAQGTKRRMCQIQRDAKQVLSGNWCLVNRLSELIRECIPRQDRPSDYRETHKT